MEEQIFLTLYLKLDKIKKYLKGLQACNSLRFAKEKVPTTAATSI